MTVLGENNLSISTKFPSTQPASSLHCQLQGGRDRCLSGGSNSAVRAQYTSSIYTVRQLGSLEPSTSDVQANPKFNDAEDEIKNMQPME